MFNIFKKEEKIANPTACIFIGRSGCGKGTQVELYMKKLKEMDNSRIVHVETGAFFREFIKGDLYTEVLTKKIVDSGGLMPEAMAINMWISYLVNNFTGKENLVFDGAPRKLMEAELLDGMLAFYNIKNYKVVYINVSHDWSKARLLARGRKDDTEEGIDKRMFWFDNDVMPSIEFFKNNKNCEFIEINGEQTVEQVHEEILKKVFNK